VPVTHLPAVVRGGSNYDGTSAAAAAAAAAAVTAAYSMTVLLAHFWAVDLVQHNTEMWILGAKNFNDSSGM